MVFCSDEQSIAGLPPSDPWATVIFNDGKLRKRTKHTPHAVGR
jgi:hypothetical protein